MLWVLMILLSTIMVLIVRNSDAASIKIPMNTTYILDSTTQSSLMNITKDEHSIGIIVGESNQTYNNNYGNEGFMIPEIRDHDLNLNISDSIVPSPPNITCIRRDYDEDVAAVFKEEVGPISDAFIVFNTTYNKISNGRIFNITELPELKLLNETTVDCMEYFFPTMKRRLKLLTKHSLIGGRK
ncbi:uncharacterized protein [Halyomorpha halys]|uniref:uncharacterized protein n=1 Tax=Halyomorpha halys TaxID=286706 RepID=UPI0006D50600|nr:uncharacterized protein LOC106679216 [Halyomorpha halys]